MIVTAIVAVSLCGCSTEDLVDPLNGEEIEIIVDGDTDESVVDSNEDQSLIDKETTEIVNDDKLQDETNGIEDTNSSGSDDEDDDDDLTDEDIDNMEIVDNAIEELLNSEEYKNATNEQKANKAIDMLHELGGQYVKQGSIYNDKDELVSFEYSCGVLGGVQIKDFNDRGIGDLMYN